MAILDDIRQAWVPWLWLLGTAYAEARDALRSTGILMDTGFAVDSHGNVVRVGPNEIAFFTPQAALDIYGAALRNQELFVKTDLMDFGAGDLGFIWETDPEKRKAVAKKILPAFSTRAIKAMEPTVNLYMDFFLSKIRESGGGAGGLLMNDWLLWLASDAAADLTYNRELHQMRDGRTSDFIEMICGSNFIGTMMQLSKNMYIMALWSFFFIPVGILQKVPAVRKVNSEGVKMRIDRRDKKRHSDFMDFMIPIDGPPPSTKKKKELTHIEQVTFQLFIASFDPINVIFYAAIYFLLKNPDVCATLTKEIRNSVKTYDEITPDRLAHLKYLHSFISETLRLHLTVATGLPRISPGATVDGIYVPKGVVCQLNTFAAQRSERYFCDPLEFHPERWLPRGHPLYSTKYSDDNLKAFFPFSIGPRQCTGKEIA